MNAMLEAILQGDRRALARALTLVENADPQGDALLEALFPHTGRAHVIGVTGPAGVGKSTLVNALARYYRQVHQPRHTVAVVAVDPTSPFTGGALLGDRIRMRDLAGDPGVFIRSMASRGAVGGLAWRTQAVVQLLDAAGFSRILVETVGAGQDEVAVVYVAHTVVVVFAPGLGDDVQALKAGQMEIADILVVNKADLPGAEHMARTLEAWRTERDGWTPRVLLTQAQQGEGVDALAQAIEEHRRFLQETPAGQAREQRRWTVALRQALQEALLAYWSDHGGEALWPQALQALVERREAPTALARRLVQQICDNPSP